MAYSVVQGTTYSLWTLSMADRTQTPLGVSSQQATNAVFSPNGRWIAYSVGASGGDQSSSSGVLVKAFPAGPTFRAPKVGLDFHPVWASDTTLVYVGSAATGELATVSVSEAGGLVFGAPVLLQARVTARRIASQARAYDILPDGRFVGLVDESEPDGAPSRVGPVIRVVLNWFGELKSH